MHLMPTSQRPEEQQARSARAPDVQLVVASPLSRAVETASLMYPEREIVCVEELREWCGQLVNSKKTDRVAAQGTVSLRRRVSSYLKMMKGGTRRSSRRRPPSRGEGMAALAWLARRPEDHIAVVAHGGLLAVTFDPEGHGGHSCVEAPNRARRGFRTANAGLCTLVTDDGGARFSVGDRRVCVSYNNGHLQPAATTRAPLDPLDLGGPARNT